VTNELADFLLAYSCEIDSGVSERRIKHPVM
jgi:hypothetical protein